MKLWGRRARDAMDVEDPCGRAVSQAVSVGGAREEMQTSDRLIPQRDPVMLVRLEGDCGLLGRGRWPRRMDYGGERRH